MIYFFIVLFIVLFIIISISFNIYRSFRLSQVLLLIQWNDITKMEKEKMELIKDVVNNFHKAIDHKIDLTMELTELENTLDSIEIKHIDVELLENIETISYRIINIITLTMVEKLSGFIHSQEMNDLYTLQEEIKQRLILFNTLVLELNISIKKFPKKFIARQLNKIPEIRPFSSIKKASC